MKVMKIFFHKISLSNPTLFFPQQQKEHCMLLALPCGRDPLDVHAQTRALKTSFIVYLQQKQAAGIINVPNSKQQV